MPGAKEMIEPTPKARETQGRMTGNPEFNSGYDQLLVFSQATEPRVFYDLDKAERWLGLET